MWVEAVVASRPRLLVGRTVKMLSTNDGDFISSEMESFLIVCWLTAECILYTASPMKTKIRQEK